MTLYLHISLGVSFSCHCDEARYVIYIIFFEATVAQWLARFPDGRVAVYTNHFKASRFFSSTSNYGPRQRKIELALNV